jgi:hypothetical protein
MLFLKKVSGIKKKSISADKVQALLGEKPSPQEIKDMEWKTYT